jgi:hypothetical protein
MKYAAIPRCRRFSVSPRCEKGAYLRRSVTDEQRWRGEKAAQPGGRGRFGLSGGVARSLKVAADMLVAPALPFNPKRSRATWLRNSTGS